jgi:hypothetical protein
MRLNLQAAAALHPQESSAATRHTGNILCS